jgi:hypothetical protein
LAHRARPHSRTRLSCTAPLERRGPTASILRKSRSCPPTAQTKTGPLCRRQRLHKGLILSCLSSIPGTPAKRLSDPLKRFVWRPGLPSLSPDTAFRGRAAEFLLNFSIVTNVRDAGIVASDCHNERMSVSLVALLRFEPTVRQVFELRWTIGDNIADLTRVGERR